MICLLYAQPYDTLLDQLLRLESESAHIDIAEVSSYKTQPP